MYMVPRSFNVETTPLFDESGKTPGDIDIGESQKPIALGFVRKDGQIINEKNGDRYDENDNYLGEKPSDALVRARRIVEEHYSHESFEAQRELVQFYRRQIEAKKGSGDKH